MSCVKLYPTPKLRREVRVMFTVRKTDRFTYDVDDITDDLIRECASEHEGEYETVTATRVEAHQHNEQCYPRFWDYDETSAPYGVSVAEARAAGRFAEPFCEGMDFRDIVIEYEEAFDA